MRMLRTTLHHPLPVSLFTHTHSYRVSLPRLIDPETPHVTRGWMGRRRGAHHALVNAGERETV